MRLVVTLISPSSEPEMKNSSFSSTTILLTGASWAKKVCLSCRCRKSKIPPMSQGKMVTFSGSKDYPSKTLKSQLFAPPPGLLPIFFLIIVFLEGGVETYPHIKRRKLLESNWLSNWTGNLWSSFHFSLATFLNVICKQLLDKAFEISGIIKVEVFGLGW